MERNRFLSRHLDVRMNRTQVPLLVLALLGDLTRFARWLVASDRDADDVVQEAVLHALSTTATPEEARRLKPWLFRIIRNVYLDQRRAQAATDRLIVLEGGLDDLAKVERLSRSVPLQWDRHDLEEALRQLPEPARTALLLSDLWGLDQDEIATVLDVPVGTVKSRVARARARVVLLLTEHEGEDLKAVRVRR